MPRLSPMTPHEYRAPFKTPVTKDGPVPCSDCGGQPAAPQHFYPEFLQDLGPTGYHHWYYNTNVWRNVTFMGVYCAKNVLDLWNYQEIMWELKPGLVVEFGTYAGGTALYLAWVMRCVHLFGQGPSPRVLTVDTDHRPLHPFARTAYALNGIETVEDFSTGEYSRSRITQNLSDAWKVSGRDLAVMFIMDSDHSKENVLAELQMLRDLTRPGDYVIVEDSNINGHPVKPDFGPGPWEAIEEYERHHPDDYEHDESRENKFGMTFNPRGYLRRK